MINDVLPPGQPNRKQKVIQPLPKAEKTVSLYDQAKLEEPSFRTPEEVAAETQPNHRPTVSVSAPYSLPNTPRSSNATPIINGKPLKKEKGGRWRLHWPHGRKQWIITSAVAVVLLGGGVTAWLLTRSAPAPAPTVAKKTVVKKALPPTPIYSNLSGLQITDPALNTKPVTAVMVENSTDARPQSGLSQAGVVFEAQAEGGITRFMALYQDTAPSNVGPVRSARPYYIQWALGFNAAYAHVGGSADALADITSWGVQDMNQFYNSGSYHRISTRPAPHNVYTGIDTLNQLESAKGYTSTFTGFTRASTQGVSPQITANSIDFAISGANYNPHYDFDAGTNTYKRSIAGTAQTDANTGQQLAPTTVIAIVVPLSRGALDASNAYYSNYNVLGGGTAYIFQNGGVAVGQWHKAGNTDQLTFTDANGAALPLNRGQTWISAVSATNQVKYTGAQ